VDASIPPSSSAWQGRTVDGVPLAVVLTWTIEAGVAVPKDVGGTDLMVGGYLVD
jgi:hypothetical protein